MPALRESNIGFYGVRGDSDRHLQPTSGGFMAMASFGKYGGIGPDTVLHKNIIGDGSDVDADNFIQIIFFSRRGARRADGEAVALGPHRGNDDVFIKINRLLRRNGSGVAGGVHFICVRQGRRTDHAHA